MPKQRGVCIPGAFVSAGNPDFRNIGSMYRINAHPDVTVFLRDSNAAVYAEEVRERNAHPQQKIRSFWAQYGMRKSVKRLASLSGVFASRNIVIAGRDGKVSTVEIERSDGHIDFGFYASVRGVPGDMGAPDIELLVISEGERAKAKGIAPIDKERFLQLARDIAETVQLRK